MFDKLYRFVKKYFYLIVSIVCLSVCILFVVFSCSSCKSSERYVVEDSHSVSIPC